MRAFDLGVLVTARAGRDKGRCFIIVGILDENYVLIADGDTRPVARPKKKKIMHIHAEPELAEDIRQKLIKGENIQDAEIRRAIGKFAIKKRPDKEG